MMELDKKEVSPKYPSHVSADKKEIPVSWLFRQESENLAKEVLDEICEEIQSWPYERKTDLEGLNEQAALAYDLFMLKRGYEGGNGFDLLRSFIRADEYGFSIPIWLCGELSSYFKKTLSSSKEPSLRKILMDISGYPGTRFKNPDKRREQESFINNLCQEIRILNTGMGFTLGIVYRLLEIVDTQTPEGLSLEAYRIEEYYKKHGKFYRDRNKNLYKQMLIQQPELRNKYIEKYCKIAEEKFNIFGEVIDQKDEAIDVPALYRKYVKRRDLFLSLFSD